MTNPLPGQDGKSVMYLVEERANPSTDYFVYPAALATGFQIVRCGPNDLPGAEDLSGATVVLVRYVPPRWARLVEATRSRLHRLVFFMDDDVLDLRASAGMPLRYRIKLARNAARHAGWLRRLDAELWVSTPWLQQKYSAWQPRLLRPFPLKSLPDVRRVFYHGTSSHAAENLWLRSVVEGALQQDERLVFEIVGGQDVYRLYRGLPRVNVVHPMRWPAYQAFLALSGRHVGLAPLLDVPFNRARSCTKFFDITRCGAVGIYSSSSICAEMVTHGVHGLVLEQDQQAWTAAILSLARDDSLRQSLLLNAEARQQELGEIALRTYSGLLDARLRDE